MSDLVALSRRRLIRMAILTTAANFVVATEIAEASSECLGGGQPCSDCRSLNARTERPSRPTPPGSHPPVNPWRDWRSLQYVASH